MNRQYLLDSLDGFKGLVFRLLPSAVVEAVACVPMTTDAPWTEAEKRAFETAIGIPATRTYWTPGGFTNVPSASDSGARAAWVRAVSAINERHIFLDPDTGFYNHHAGPSAKTVLVQELSKMQAPRRTLIVYRHQYWPRAQQNGTSITGIQYVRHGLLMLQKVGMSAFVYQSQSASVFFVAQHREDLEPFETGFRTAFAGISEDVLNRRLVT